ncbi:hypothetical protein F9U64_06615 [Gracilibacillus oryzae]|uniref:Uncharacterized protein n=1 Tax=Gracilibacillus oryzae TaxID=1672701 RepID=A0A7C8GUD4_9BACI|nr:hypothetical protein [Gracilibacillus oryzae]KAB8138112.1 hypothetical protein F9U64_06615 [Gracilibacillus oryzae]
MIIRKTMTTILATFISMTILSIFIFGEIGADLFQVVLFSSMVFSPFILFYGVPVTFFSDFVTKRFSGARRVLLAMVIHVLFGIIFAFLFTLLGDPSEGEFLVMFFVGATTVAFFFGAIDEIL